MTFGIYARLRKAKKVTHMTKPTVSVAQEYASAFCLCAGAHWPELAAKMAQAILIIQVGILSVVLLGLPLFAEVGRKNIAPPEVPLFCYEFSTV